jgi:hypothetical protein
MDKEQTAVEWLFNEITLQYVAKGNLSFMDIVNMSQQAKEIEKEQIKIAYYNGTTDQIKTKDELLLEAEHYYNESFGGMGQ